MRLFENKSLAQSYEANIKYRYCAFSETKLTSQVKRLRQLCILIVSALHRIDCSKPLLKRLNFEMRADRICFHHSNRETERCPDLRTAPPSQPTLAPLISPPIGCCHCCCLCSYPRTTGLVQFSSKVRLSPSPLTHLHLYLSVASAEVANVASAKYRAI